MSTAEYNWLENVYLEKLHSRHFVTLLAFPLLRGLYSCCCKTLRLRRCQLKDKTLSLIVPTSAFSTYGAETSERLSTCVFVPFNPLCPDLLTAILFNITAVCYYLKIHQKNISLITMVYKPVNKDSQFMHFKLLDIKRNPDIQTPDVWLDFLVCCSKLDGEKLFCVYWCEIKYITVCLTWLTLGKYVITIT